MAKYKGPYEYVVRPEKPGGKYDYEVLKFHPDELADGGQPLATYNIMYDPPRQLGRCNCHAATYRGTANVDKHIKIVEQWVANGRTGTVVV